ncbi:MAG TPA: hypothetical protein VKX17_06990 [Planctomycetota bacterium]|nr:hypothetical protein [Planctomycetota bacterium]
MDDVNAVAAVDPAIERPAERIIQLLGLWVQRERGERFSLSPLICAIKAKLLLPETEKKCNHTFAVRIVSKKKIDILDAEHAVLYFWNAMEFNRGAVLLMSVFDCEIKQLKFDRMGRMFDEMPELPREIDLDLRLALRAAQIALLDRRQKLTDAVFDDLDRLMQQVKPQHGIGVYSVVVRANNVIAKRNLKRANRYVLQAVQLNGVIPLPEGTFGYHCDHETSTRSCRPDIAPARACRRIFAASNDLGR